MNPSATTFYAFTYDNTYDGVYPTYNNTFEAILVKSNSNPASATNLTWSVVSRIDSRSLTGAYSSMLDVHNYACAVSTQGVFTLVGRSKGTATFITPIMPLGIRYDPTWTMDSKYNFKGPGGWMNISIDANYNWQATFLYQSLAYVNNSGGGSALVHAFMASGSTSVNIATMNEATKTLTAAAVWSLNLTSSAIPRVLTISNDHLYTFAVEYGLHFNPTYLSGLPLSTITITPPVHQELQHEPDNRLLLVPDNLSLHPRGHIDSHL
ncbi:hypothetical protein BGZ47_002561 [Haplosporangium gracile]|nr:hypothetical protein BGZ47_002561 [Haplosporangium gracile]